MNDTPDLGGCYDAVAEYNLPYIPFALIQKGANDRMREIISMEQQDDQYDNRELTELVLHHMNLGGRFLDIIGHQLSKQGQYEDAISFYDLSVLSYRQKGLNPDYRGLMNGGVACIESKEYQQSVNLLIQAIESPYIPEEAKWVCYSNLGLAYLHLGEYEKAITFFTEALNDPYFPENQSPLVHIMLVGSCLAAGRHITTGDE
ncbi:MAG: tetratricopeptide repeat protein [Candidatus Gracilibacteria bacterium]|nr:tetratricopeptide repeat protein [Candidatus Gracilibacteria bacterium]